MPTILVSAASAAVLILALSGPAGAQDTSSPPPLTGSQGGTAGEAATGLPGSGTALTPEGAVDCPPGSEEAICRNQADGTATRGTSGPGQEPAEETAEGTRPDASAGQPQ